MMLSRRHEGGAGGMYLMLSLSLTRKRRDRQDGRFTMLGEEKRNWRSGRLGKGTQLA